MLKLSNYTHLDNKVKRSHVEAVVSRLSYSDWLILFYLAQSMDKNNFGTLLAQIADDLPEYPTEEDGDEENGFKEPGTLRSSIKLRNLNPLKK